MAVDVREKLVELQLRADIADNVSENTTQHREFTADFMIANGVTVQVPQKPIEHKVEGDGIRIGACLWGKGTTIHKCPKCGNFISRMYDYCFKCGQAFDWSDMPQPPKGG